MRYKKKARDANRTHFRAVAGDDLAETFLQNEFVARRESKEGSGTELMLTVLRSEVEGQSWLSCERKEKRRET